MLRGRKVFIIDILYDFVIMKGHFIDGAILTPLSPESFNFLILFNISACFVLLSLSLSAILYWVIHFFLYLFHIFFSPFFVALNFIYFLLHTHTHSQRHFFMLFTLSGILFSLSTLGALILHGVLKIYYAKGDLAEK